MIFVAIFDMRRRSVGKVLIKIYKDLEAKKKKKIFNRASFFCIFLNDWLIYCLYYLRETGILFEMQFLPLFFATYI